MVESEKRNRVVTEVVGGGTEEERRKGKMECVCVCVFFSRLGGGNDEQCVNRRWAVLGKWAKYGS